MTNVRIVGKKNSKAKKEISSETNIPIYRGQKGTEIIINYGLNSHKIQAVIDKYPLFKEAIIINKNVGRSKYSVIKMMEKCGILVPKSLLSLPDNEPLSRWIEKKIHSSQGNGIFKATKRNRIPGKYYQKIVQDRSFELRVHAFLWIPKKEWVVHKRVGSQDKTVWNYHKGGHFCSMHDNGNGIVQLARDISEKVLKVVGMDFGAVDLIVDKNNNIYFIEINSLPGFANLSKSIYVKAMSLLKSTNVENLKKLIN